MKISSGVKFDMGGAAEVQLDLTKVKMSDEQRSIVQKLIASIKPSETVSISEQDQCEIGKCVASRYLPDEEFKKIRGLKATLGSEGATAGILCDFCLHFVAV